MVAHGVGVPSDQIRFRVERGEIGVKSLPLIQSPLGLLHKPPKFALTLAPDSLAALAT